MPVNRKLVAVVMADVVGYSRLMERDEAGTHQRLLALHDELLAPKITEHGGRTVKTAGDGMLLEFPSATSALRCAVEIQRELGARNLYVAPDGSFSIVALVWRPGQITRIHDHITWCVFGVIQGVEHEVSIHIYGTDITRVGTSARRYDN